MKKEDEENLGKKISDLYRLMKDNNIDSVRIDYIGHYRCKGIFHNFVFMRSSRWVLSGYSFDHDVYKIDDEDSVDFMRGESFLFYPRWKKIVPHTNCMWRNKYKYLRLFNLSKLNLNNLSRRLDLKIMELL